MNVYGTTCCSTSERCCCRRWQDKTGLGNYGRVGVYLAQDEMIEQRTTVLLKLAEHRILWYFRRDSRHGVNGFYSRDEPIWRLSRIQKPLSF